MPNCVCTLASFPGSPLLSWDSLGVRLYLLPTLHFTTSLLASFPGSSALEREIELVHAERAWYFFSRESPLA